MRTCLLTGSTGVLGSDFIARYRDIYAIAALTHARPARTPGARIEIQADLTDQAAVSGAIAETVDRLGPIDLIVNAAAIGTSRAERELSPDALLAVLAVNVAAPAWIAATVAARCWSDRSPRRPSPGIVNVSSTSGHIVYPGTHDVAYATSKAALNMLTVQLASTLEPSGVRVNAVAPTSFPRLIPTQRVSDAIVELDRSARTGGILVLESSRRYWLEEDADDTDEAT